MAALKRDLVDPDIDRWASLDPRWSTAKLEVTLPLFLIRNHVHSHQNTKMAVSRPLRHFTRTAPSFLDWHLPSAGRWEASPLRASRSRVSRVLVEYSGLYARPLLINDNIWRKYVSCSRVHGAQVGGSSVCSLMLCRAAERHLDDLLCTIPRIC